MQVRDSYWMHKYLPYIDIKALNGSKDIVSPEIIKPSRTRSL